MILTPQKPLFANLNKNEKNKNNSGHIIMKGMKIYGSFNADSYQEVSIDWLTATLKYDNHGGGKRMLLTQGSWDEKIAYWCTLSMKLGS